MLLHSGLEFYDFNYCDSRFHLFILRFLTEVQLFVTSYVNLSLTREYSIMQEYKRVFSPAKHY